MEPHDLRVVQSLVGEHFVGAKFAGKGVAVPAVRPERTFLEKVFLLHEEFQRPAGKMRVDRLSRHLYDVFQLSGTSFGEAALKDSELYETIVRHRYQFTRIGGVDYNLHQPQTINPIPVAEVISQWKADYLTMQEQMIYGESPSFEELLNSVRETTSRFNSQEWKMEIVFGKR